MPGCELIRYHDGLTFASVIDMAFEVESVFGEGLVTIAVAPQRVRDFRHLVTSAYHLDGRVTHRLQRSDTAAIEFVEVPGLPADTVYAYADAANLVPVKPSSEQVSACFERAEATTPIVRLVLKGYPKAPSQPPAASQAPAFWRLASRLLGR